MSENLFISKQYGGIIVENIPVTAIRKRGGVMKSIHKGTSYVVTRSEEPAACLRPYKPEDEGERIDANSFYQRTGKYLNHVQEGETVVILKRGEPVATLCSLEAKEPPPKKERKGKPRAKRRPKTSKPSPPPPPTEADETSADTVTPSTLAEPIRILEAADRLTPGRALMLLELADDLELQGELETGVRLLRALITD